MRRSLANLQQAITDARSAAMAHYRLGVFHDNNGRERLAIPCYRRAIRLGLPAPTAAEASAWLASSLYKTGQFRAALRQCDRTLDMRAAAPLKTFIAGLRRRIGRRMAGQGTA